MGNLSWASETRNILFISADQWRAECLSSLGHPTVKTPSLDGLAADGVSFVQHYAQCIKCGPSRASIHTGMYLQNHRSVTNASPLDARHTNIALECRKLGYDPALIGYTSTSADPRELSPNDPVLKSYHEVLPGFRSVLGKYVKAISVEWMEWLAEKGYEICEDPYDTFAPIRDYPDASDRGVTYPPPRYKKDESDIAFQTDAALKYMRTHRKEPWFLHLSYGRPHPPYSVPEPYNRMYEPEDVPEFRRAPTVEQEAAQHPFLAMLLDKDPVGKSWGARRYPRDDRTMRQVRATYYGMMSEVDHHIGRLVASLKESGQYEDTLIIFGSDHGEQLWDHWMLGKGPYFDQGFHVPLIICAPGEQMDGSRGQVVKELTENVDIMPTVMELLGLEIPLQCDGASLQPFLQGDQPKRWREEAHWEIDFRDVEHGEPEKALGIRFDECCLNVIRGERYKYVHFAALPSLFFDMEKDPDELHNLAQEPEYRELVLRYAQKMISWRMANDERTLTGMKVGPQGVIQRARSTWYRWEKAGDHDNRQ